MESVRKRATMRIAIALTIMLAFSLTPRPAAAGTSAGSEEPREQVAPLIVSTPGTAAPASTGVTRETRMRVGPFVGTGLGSGGFAFRAGARFEPQLGARDGVRLEGEWTYEYTGFVLAPSDTAQNGIAASASWVRDFHHGVYTAAGVGGFSLTRTVRNVDGSRTTPVSGLTAMFALGCRTRSTSLEGRFEMGGNFTGVVMAFGVGD